MKTQPLIEALKDQSVSRMVYVIADRHGHLIYVGSSDHTVGWRLHRHQTFRHGWPLREWFDVQTTTAISLADVTTLSPSEVAEELGLDEVPTLRRAERLYQRAHAPIQFCSVWATSAAQPTMFTVETSTGDVEDWLEPDGSRKRR